MTTDVFYRSRAAAAAITDRLGGHRPRLGVVLGSGLGSLVERVDGAVTVAYADVPYHRAPTTPGNAGAYVGGSIGGLEVLVASGRLHAYEGYALDEVTFPIRVFGALGAQAVLLTNAAGGVDPSLAAGDLMVVDDHLNLTATSPLVGPNDERLGPRFPDMSSAYDVELSSILDVAAEDAGVDVRHGIYAGVLGPAYETPAEIRMLRLLGADAVGMSTVPEVIVARHELLRVACVSCITNAAAGSAGSPLSHTEVTETAARSSGALSALLVAFCRRFAS